MTAAELPIPPEMFFDEAPPLSDDDLDRLFAAAELLVDPPEGTSAYSSVDDAVAGLAEGEDAPSYAKAQATARWQVDNDRDAAWVASKLAAAEGEVTRLAEQRDEWMERIGAWFDQASKKPRRTALFMRGHLERYGLRVREETGQATLSLPDATVKTTHHKQRVEVVDDDVLADWLDAHRADWRERFWPDGVFDEEAWAKLVRRTAKVYVGEARKLLNVVAVDAGWSGSVLMDCGHRDSAYRALEGEEMDLPERGDPHVCHECEPVGVMRLVEAVFMEHLTRPVVMGVDAEVVPGVTVKPAETTATVEVNG